MSYLDWFIFYRKKRIIVLSEASFQISSNLASAKKISLNFLIFFILSTVLYADWIFEKAFQTGLSLFLALPVL